jgi:uncharacterized repeat protein (TIGR01451 family)
LGLLAAPSSAQELTAGGGVADPPPPQVRIQVRTPSASPPGKPIQYRLIVSNPAAERAYKVRVRNPIPPNVQVGKTDPPLNVAPGAKELVWELGELGPAAQRVLTLELTPAAGTREVRNQAFVTSEYGQSVLTKIEDAKLKVEKAAPKTAAAGEPVPVEVRVTNAGAVPVLDVELVETITDGFRFDDRGDGRRGATAAQRVWKLGTLSPGQARTVRYNVRDGTGAKLTTTSAVTGHGVSTPDTPKQTDTELLTPGLVVELAGPATVAGGQRGKYTAVARNTGTLPLQDVRIVATLPAGCGLKRQTNGGQRTRDAVEWVVPRLDPGETYSVRFELDSATSGKKTVTATARSRAAEAPAKEATTVYEGTSVLGLKATAEPSLPAVGTQGTLTLTIDNSGTEAARNARLRVEIPDGVTLVSTSPKDAQATKAEVLFPAVTVRPREPQRFTVTFRADKPGIVYFRTSLEATGLGDRPLVKEQSVEVMPR